MSTLFFILESREYFWDGEGPAAPTSTPPQTFSVRLEGESTSSSRWFGQSSRLVSFSAGDLNNCECRRTLLPCWPRCVIRLLCFQQFLASVSYAQNVAIFSAAQKYFLKKFAILFNKSFFRGITSGAEPRKGLRLWKKPKSMSALSRRCRPSWRFWRRQ